MKISLPKRLFSIVWDVTFSTMPFKDTMRVYSLTDKQVSFLIKFCFTPLLEAVGKFIQGEFLAHTFVLTVEFMSK